MTSLPDPAAVAVDHTASLVPDWVLALRAEDKSPQTIAVYTRGLHTYLDWCTAGDHAPLTRAALAIWTAEVIAGGYAPGTARTRQLAVRRYGAWLWETEQISFNPYLGIKGPKHHVPLTIPLNDDELRALIATCTTPTHRPEELLHHRRDEAIIRIMLETGMRSGELIALELDDIDLPAGRIVVRRGKGGAGRTVPIGPAAIRALDVYLSVRRHHKLAESTDLWLGERGRPFGYDGLGKGLRRRALEAGITGFHPHKLRHTAAHRWLAHGGTENGLMAIAGWTRTDMLIRYTRAHAADRAAAEARRLNLGEL